MQYTGHSLRVIRDWLITARKLITQNSPNANYTKKNKYIYIYIYIYIYYICTYIDQLAVNNCQL